MQLLPLSIPEDASPQLISSSRRFPFNPSPCSERELHLISPAATLQKSSLVSSYHSAHLLHPPRDSHHFGSLFTAYIKKLLPAICRNNKVYKTRTYSAHIFKTVVAPLQKSTIKQLPTAIKPTQSSPHHHPFYINTNSPQSSQNLQSKSIPVLRLEPNQAKPTGPPPRRRRLHRDAITPPCLHRRNLPQNRPSCPAMYSAQPCHPQPVIGLSLRSYQRRSHPLPRRPCRPPLPCRRPPSQAVIATENKEEKNP
ncbi:hypothetical protein M0R45_019505 [Rubus argutus]|uniref:Uncharacterized protein n=1 Tax=Rubus argutus TaxID=59490 RepID=A0AAW1X7I9_RUBAR